MVIEYWIPAYLENSPYGTSVKQWNETGTTLDDERRLSGHPRLPSKLNQLDRFPNIQVENDGLDAKFGPHEATTDSAAASVRTNHPIPPSCGIYYFEIEILSKGVHGHGSWLDSLIASYIGIGFCLPSVNLNRLPGWEVGSWGYHGDDGHAFAASGIGNTYGPAFTTGDIIGCCIDFNNGSAFYTKNGKQLGTAFTGLTPNRVGTELFPTLGLRSPGEHVRVNFGQVPFTFDIVGYIEVISF
jgi:Ran-binding protein 9/10